MAVIAAAFLSSACRLGFDELASLDGPGDASITDTRVTKTVGFGEYPNADVSNVTQDTEVTEDLPTMNVGSEEFSSLVGAVGMRARALLRFDVSSVPPGTTATSAVITLSIVDFGDQAQGPVEVAPVLESWTELEATWNQRDSLRGWTTVGGTRGAAGGSVVVGATTLTVTLPTPWVQGWIDDPASNAGIIVSVADDTDTHYHFATREAVTADARPRLMLQLLE